MNRNIIIAVIALAAALGIGAYMYTGAGDMPDQAAMSEDSDASAEMSKVTEMTLGDVNAPVKLIEYSSYTCPHCAAFHVSSFEQLKAEYIDTGKVHFTYREVYFDRIGLWASMVARCGGEEKFFGINDLIMKGQKDWLGDGDPVQIADRLRKVGRVAGLESDAIDACLEGEGTAQELVDWYQKNADTHAIQSTPSFIVDDELIAGNNYAKVKAAIDAQLGE